MIIRWNETGSAEQVRIDLLKGGSYIALIAITGNDGHKSWGASTLGALSGSDFSIRVTAVGEDNCSATSDEFTILDTTGCNFTFTMEQGISLAFGTQFQITWDSFHTTDVVDLELMRSNMGLDNPVGYIATNVANVQTYSWTVDSLNQGTYHFYFLRISDPNVPGCQAISPTFSITDEDICEIWVNAPQPNDVWHPGEVQTITFTPADLATTDVIISLYQGLVFVLTIGSMEVIPDQEQSYDWPVTTGFDHQGDQYRIKIRDAADTYCVGWSGDFTINEN